MTESVSMEKPFYDWISKPYATNWIPTTYHKREIYFQRAYFLSDEEKHKTDILYTRLKSYNISSDHIFHILYLSIKSGISGEEVYNIITNNDTDSLDYIGFILENKKSIIEDIRDIGSLYYTAKYRYENSNFNIFVRNIIDTVLKPSIKHFIKSNMQILINDCNVDEEWLIMLLYQAYLNNPISTSQILSLTSNSENPEDTQQDIVDRVSHMLYIFEKTGYDYELYQQITVMCYENQNLQTSSQSSHMPVQGKQNPASQIINTLCTNTYITKKDIYNILHRTIIGETVQVSELIPFIKLTREPANIKSYLHLFYELIDMYSGNRMDKN